MRLLLILLLLAGCAATTPQSSEEKTFVYDCRGGYTFTVRQSPDSAWVFLPSGTHQLMREPSASGVRYRTEEILFWSKGQEALLEMPGQPKRECSNNPPAAIWEDAKFRGVDFRAVGNEPGWYLELDREKILYAGNYGQQVLTFIYAPPQVDDSRAQTVYNALAGEDHFLELKLQAGYCIDSMSGERFGTRVTLRLDGKTYYGCGRALH